MSPRRKGIILAGGSGTRLFPATLSVSKQLLPVYDKPMVYYPLSVLMLAGIRDVLVISTPQDTPRFEQLLGDGQRWGDRLRSTAVQPSPDGLAQAFIIGAEFVGGGPTALVLGDNIFYGHDLQRPAAQRRRAHERRDGLRLSRARSGALRRGGVRRLAGARVSIEEKPRAPKSRYAVTGLYFYDEQRRRASPRTSGLGARRAGDHRPQPRSTSSAEQLGVELMGRGFAWLDTGTHDSLLEAGQFIATIEKRQGLKIACPEEVAWRNGWIDDRQLEHCSASAREVELRSVPALARSRARCTA